MGCCLGLPVCPLAGTRRGQQEMWLWMVPPVLDQPQITSEFISLLGMAPPTSQSELSGWQRLKMTGGSSA